MKMKIVKSSSSSSSSSSAATPSLTSSSAPQIDHTTVVCGCQKSAGSRRVHIFFLTSTLTPQTLGMASCSKGEIGALNSEGFSERILSNANDVMDKGNTLLGDEELEMLVVLRMNRDFMRFMRKNYNDICLQQFRHTVVLEVDNVADSDDDDNDDIE